MDLLQHLLDVSLVLGPRTLSAAKNTGTPLAPSPAAAQTPSPSLDGGEIEGMRVISRQPLRGRLTLTCNNTDGAKTSLASAFLSQVGENSFPDAWRHLFGRLILVPFLMDRGETDESFPAGGSSTHTLASPTSSPPPSCRATVTPRVGVNSNEGNFVFGVPTFWNEKLYAHAHSDEDEGDDNNSQGREEDSGGASVLHDRARRLPCRTAGEPFTVNAMGNKTVVTPSPVASRPAGGEGEVNAADIPARVVSTYDFDFTVPEVNPQFLNHPASLAFVLLLSPLVDPQAPDAGSMKVTANEDGEPDTASLTTGTEDWLPYQRYITMRVLSRAFLNPFDPSTGGLASLYSRHTLLLGCQYLPVTVKRALACQSVTCPLSNDRLLLNLNIMNVSSTPVVLHSASLDVYASRVATTVSGGAHTKHKGASHAWSAQQHQERRSHQAGLWAEQRAGPAGSDMRTIDVLTKIVTVTPMVVSDDRPPFILHAEETYAFQFIIEVLPQLCYLLNPKSLQYVYARHARQQRAEREEAEQARQAANLDVEGSVGPGAAGRPVAVGGGGGSGAEAVITDCFGEPVSNEEILQVLSGSYLSYLFVYFDLLETGDHGGGVGEEEVHVTTTTPFAAGHGVDAKHHATSTHSSSFMKADGLHLRHAAKWSFGAV